MNLHDKIDNLLQYVPHGWCSVRKAHTMAALVTALRPQTVVEIGVYAGRSFLPMVLALHEIGAGMAYGIDPYDAKVSAEGETEENAAWWGSFDHRIIESMFLSVMDALPEMAPRWVHVRQKSDDFTPPKEIGVLHIDGSHTDAAIRDVGRYAGQVVRGGFVVLDDLLWKSGAVSASITHLEALGFKELYRVIGKEEGTPFEDNWGVFQRIA
jgi:hypothetical protein